ncbi:MAG: isoprenylcysteine carboxylmethyltransferase family protein [Acidobacteria bacterium]|nr:isoprenylcysteine carboxylmethyltransferase family protein [Acidobacteriota bacterium]
MADRSATEIIRLTLLWASILALAAFSRPTVTSVAAGAVLLGVGESVRIWAAGHLFKTRELITSGPYRRTRNPLYLGRLLILTGLALMAWFSPLLNATLLCAGWLFFFGYYLPRKERIEPARLQQLHGDAYVAYRETVPALLPTAKPWPDNGVRWRLDRFIKNREHLTAAGLAAIVLVFALRAAGAFAR